MSTSSDNNTEYILSGTTGKIKKRVKIRTRKKQRKFTRASVKKILTHPVMIALFILLIAAVVFFSLPTSSEGNRKWKLRGDEKTKEINKTIKETDAYE